MRIDRELEEQALAEAAATGPVPFGPLAERLPDLPVAPQDWEVKTLADACL